MKREGLFMRKVCLLILAAAAAFFTSCSSNADFGGDTASLVPPAESSSDGLISFSPESGIYSTNIDITLACADENLTIRYEKGWQEPTAESDEYTEPIPVRFGSEAGDGSCVRTIRAAAFDSGGNMVGGVETATYILNESPAYRFQCMVICLTGDEDGFYGYENGILVAGRIRDEFLAGKRPAGWSTGNLDANYFQYGREWERPVHIDMFDSDGSLMLSQNGGVRVQGGWTRGNAQKSLRLYARYEYSPGTNTFRVPDLFPGLINRFGEPVAEFRTLSLRTGSNQNYDSIINSQFMMNMATGLDIYAPNTRTAAVYINGKYYGAVAVTEDFSDSYFETYYGIPSDEISAINGKAPISGGNKWILDCGPESEYYEFTNMMDFIIDSDMTDEANYAKALTMLDIDDFLSYMVCEAYVGCTDWPQNNVRVWRRYTDGYVPDAAEYGCDGRWRFTLKDLDFAGGNGEGANTSILVRINKDDRTLRLNAVFKSLYKNEDFQKRFWAAVCDQLNTVFEPEYALKRICETQLAMTNEARYYFKTYGVNNNSLKTWDDNLVKYRSFFVARYDNVWKELDKKVGTNRATVSLSVEGCGTVKLNTLRFTTDEATAASLSKTLNYMQSMTLPFSATPAEGWELESVEISGLKQGDGSVTVSAATGSISVRFAKKSQSATVVINEVMYSHVPGDETPDWVELYNAGDAPVYLRGWKLQRLSANGSVGTSYTFPGVSIKPGEYLVIVCGKNTDWDGLRASFTLAPDDAVAITDASGTRVDTMQLGGRGLSYCSVRYPDGNASGGVRYSVSPTPGATNSVSSGYVFASCLPPSAAGKVYIRGSSQDRDYKIEGGQIMLKYSYVKDLLGSSANNSRVKIMLSDFNNNDYVPLNLFIDALDGKYRVVGLDSGTTFVCKMK